MITARFFAGKRPVNLVEPLNERLEASGAHATVPAPGSYEGQTDEGDVVLRIQFFEPGKQDHDEYTEFWRNYASEAPALVTRAEIDFVDEDLIPEVSDVLEKVFGESILEINDYPLWLGGEPHVEVLRTEDALQDPAWASRVRRELESVEYRPWEAARKNGRLLAELLGHPQVLEKAEWAELMRELIALTPHFEDEFESEYDMSFDEDAAVDTGFTSRYVDDYATILDAAAEVLGKPRAVLRAEWPELVRELIEAYAERSPLDPTPVMDEVLLTDDARRHDAWVELVGEFVETHPEEAQIYLNHEMLRTHPQRARLRSLAGA